MKAIVLVILYACIFLLIGASTCSLEHKPVIFSVIGDIPYDNDQKNYLIQQIVKHNESSTSSFFVHLGDIQHQISSPCNEAVYATVAEILKGLIVPTFIIPGDNEWSDCPDENQAWVYWSQYFLKFEENWNNVHEVWHQKTRTENFGWVYDGVLFIGINIVGGGVDDDEEWNRLLKDDAKWVDKLFKKWETVRAAVVFGHAKTIQSLSESPEEGVKGINYNIYEPFLTPFRVAARDFNKPVLFINGDGHEWLYDRPWEEKNILRVQVEGGKTPPVEVTVTLDNSKPFVFDRNPF